MAGVDWSSIGLDGEGKSRAVCGEDEVPCQLEAEALNAGDFLIFLEEWLLDLKCGKTPRPGDATLRFCACLPAGGGPHEKSPPPAWWSLWLLQRMDFLSQCDTSDLLWSETHIVSNVPRGPQGHCGSCPFTLHLGSLLDIIRPLESR